MRRQFAPARFVMRAALCFFVWWLLGSKLGSEVRSRSPDILRTLNRSTEHAQLPRIRKTREKISKNITSAAWRGWTLQAPNLHTTLCGLWVSHPNSDLSKLRAKRPCPVGLGPPYPGILSHLTWKGFCPNAWLSTSVICLHILTERPGIAGLLMMNLILREGGTPFHLSPSLHKKGRHDRRGWGAQMDENFEGDGIFLKRENHKKKKKERNIRSLIKVI